MTQQLALDLGHALGVTPEEVADDWRDPPLAPARLGWRRIGPDTDFDHATHDWRELPDGSIWIRPVPIPEIVQ